MRRDENAMKSKALLVGINDYAPVGPGGPDLRGCVNDVRDMAQTLNALGLVPPIPAAMRILTDMRATRANILAGFRWLLSGAVKGDRLIFFYSGHGSQVLDVNGEEIDKRDETLCPHDYATAGMIKDDDLRVMMRGLPAGVNLDVIFDSCHAGTGTRVLDSIEFLPEEEMVAYRYVEPPLDYGFFLDANPSIPVNRLMTPENCGNGNGAGGKTAGGKVDTKEVVHVAGLNHVLWAACRDNQTSAEAPVGGVWRGIFTYCFCRALRRAGTTITRRRLDGLVGVDVSGMGYSQVLQLEVSGRTADERVFM
jgi:hypothetical protein